MPKHFESKYLSSFRKLTILVIYIVNFELVYSYSVYGKYVYIYIYIYIHILLMHFYMFRVFKYFKYINEICIVNKTN